MTDIQRNIQQLQQCEVLFNQWLIQPMASDDLSPTEKNWIGLCDRIEKIVAALEQAPLSCEAESWLNQFKRRMQQKIPDMAHYCDALETAMAAMNVNKSAAWAYHKAQLMET